MICRICFIVFAEELRGNQAKYDTNLLGFCVGGPRAKIISAEGAGEDLVSGLGQGGRAKDGAAQTVTYTKI